MAWFKPKGGVNIDFVTAGAEQILSGYIGANADGDLVNGLIPTKNDSGNTTLSAASGAQSRSYVAGYYPNAHGAKITLEEKSATPSAIAKEVTPTSGKVLSKVTVAGDANLVAGNILDDVSIFGVTGNVKKTASFHGEKTSSDSDAVFDIVGGGTTRAYYVNIPMTYKNMVGFVSYLSGYNQCSLINQQGGEAIMLGGAQTYSLIPRVSSSGANLLVPVTRANSIYRVDVSGNY